MWKGARLHRSYKVAALGATLTLIVAACSSAATPTATPSLSSSAIPNAIQGETPTPTPLPTPAPGLAERLGISTFSTLGWRTNFEKHSVDYGEIISGQVKDGIPSIDSPKFESLAAAGEWLKDRVPVAAVELNGEARAYPLGILIWHEIVNDTIGGIAVAITFCPLCNTAIAFERVLDGQVLEFGTTGNLRNSDLVMYDRQTESWWQQATGGAIAGDLTGKRLTFLPASIVSFKDFREAFPSGQVLSRDTGFFGSYSDLYGNNPYSRYDDQGSFPFLFTGKADSRLPLLERVVGLSLNGVDKAYSFRSLSEERAVNDVVGGRPVAILWKAGTTSALDGPDIAASRDVGATGVFDPVVGGRRLTFQADGDGFFDKETGTRWNILGHALSGPLTGQRLERILHADYFWFSWAAFNPDTLIYGK